MGYARVDITPDYPVPMSGYGNTSSRFSQNVLDPVYTTFKPTGRYEINAGWIGGFAFVTSPFETFSAHGLHVKGNSPFHMMMVFSCASQYHSYVPTADAYEYGCYESWTAYYDPALPRQLLPSSWKCSKALLRNP